MGLPQHNGRVTAVSNGGASADYDYEGGPDEDVWSGDAVAYVSEAKRLVPGEGRVDRLSTDFVIVPDLGVTINEGQYVTFKDDEGDTHTRRILTVAERPKLPGMLRTTKLYLESA